MAFQKYARAEIIGVKTASSQVRTASIEAFAKDGESEFNDYRTDDGYMYVRVRAISSRVNKNHDGWPSTELQKAAHTFLGKPVFVDHHNHDPKRARGVVVDVQTFTLPTEKVSASDPYYASAPDEHLPPTHIELLLEMDAKAFPKLCKAIADGDIDAVSMGANVGKSVCSHCGNVAHAPDEYCQHIRSKGAHFDRTNRKTGKKESVPSYEDCYDIGFFEISHVFDPADETAKHLQLVAAIRKEAAIHDEIGEVVTDHVAAILAREFSEEEREKDAENGDALPDGSFPIENKEDLENAEHLKGKAKDPAKAERHIKERAKELGVKASADPDDDNDEEHFIEGWPTKCPYCSHKLTSNGDCNHCGAKSSTRESYTDHVAAILAAEEQRLADTRQMPQSEMTVAPEKVDTLRQDTICPICGSEMEDGACEVCNFEEPPEGFGNPDLDKAKELDQEQAQQGTEAEDAQAQSMQNEQMEQMQQGAPAGPQSGMPMAASVNPTSSGPVKGEQKHAADLSGGRVNTQEKPILPATRQATDKPKANKTVSDSLKPVQSNNKEDHMSTDNQKTADGPRPNGGADVQPATRVDVTGVGGVGLDPESGIKTVDPTGVGGVGTADWGERVDLDGPLAEEVGDHTDTWHGNEGDSAGQHDPVTDETTATLASAVLTEDPATHVELDAPLLEEVGDPTKTFGSDDFHITDPVTREAYPSDEEKVKAAKADARAQIMAALKVAEAEVSLGLIPVEQKIARLAELENESTEALEATLASYSRVKTAGLAKRVARAGKASSGAIPSLAPVTSSLERREASSGDEGVEIAESIFAG